MRDLSQDGARLSLGGARLSLDGARISPDGPRLSVGGARLLRAADGAHLQHRAVDVRRASTIGAKRSLCRLENFPDPKMLL